MPSTDSGDVTVTPAVAKVLHAFLDDPAARRYGFELMQMTGLASGSLYPVLARLENAKWIIGEKETVDPAAAGRPARRYYVITAEGVRDGVNALAAMRHEFRPPKLSPMPDQLRGPGRHLGPFGGRA
jgi:PadR family transcriptional regulator PadR